MQEIKSSQDFKIRCSCIGKIMGRLVTISEEQKLEMIRLSEKSKGDPLTENQRKDLTAFQEQLRAGEKELTPAQQKKYESLLEKSRSNPLTPLQIEKLEMLKDLAKRPPELPKGAKTYVEKWIKENLIYKRRKLLGNKYTKKGNDVEQDSINLISKYYDLGEIHKNEIRIFDHPFLDGECDVKLAGSVIDAKSSYTFDTFPLFEEEIPNTDYEDQIKGYCELYNVPFGLVCYALTNATEELIDKECNNQKWILGLKEVTKELYDEVKRSMTYDDIDILARVKAYRFDRDDEFIKEVCDRVVMCRAYGKEVLQKFKENLKKQKTLLN